MILLSLFYFVGYSQTWQNVGPGAGSDLHFAAIQPDNEDIIYVGGDIEGIFKTTDGGNRWKNINNNIAHSNLGAGVYWTNDIVIDPTKYDRVYYCSGVGLFVSNNEGDSWNLIYPLSYIPDEEAYSVSTIAVDPNDSNRLFIGLGDGAVGSFADFEPFEDFDQPTGVFKSLDGGESWNKLSIGMPAYTNVHSIIIVPDEPEKIIVSTSKGVYKSTNGGDNWQSSNTGLPHTNVHRLVGKQFGSDFIIYATMKTIGDTANPNSFEGGIFKSTDLGDNWISITGNLPRYNTDAELFFEYWKLDAHPTDPNIIVTATTRGSSWEEAGVYATYDGGATWDYIYYPIIGGWMEGWFDDPYGFDIKIAPSNPSRWVLLLDNVEVSNNAGNTWSPAFTTQLNNAWKGNGLELMNTETIAFHPTNNDIFWVGYDDMGLFRTDDGGNTFIRLDPVMDPIIGNLSDIDAVKDIEVDPVNGDLYISRYQGSQGGYEADFSSGGIAFSNDIGDTQVDISSGLPLGRCDLILDRTSGEPGKRILYTAIFHHGIYKSTNSGQTWFEISNGLGSNKEYVWKIAVDPSNTSTLYLGLNSRGLGLNGFYKSTNSGESWNLISNFPAGDILSIHVNSLEVFAGVTDNFDWNYNGGLYRSSNGGDSWSKILNHSRIAGITSFPGNDDILLAAGQQWYRIGEDKPGLFISSDRGNNWNDISDGLNHTFINTARFNPSDINKVFVCTVGGGLWKIDNATLKLDEEAQPKNYQLFQNYPNPFNPTTSIKYQILNVGNVKLTVYNSLGQRVKTLVDKKQLLGVHEVQFNAENLPSGVYFYKLEVNNFRITKKMLLLK